MQKENPKPTPRAEEPQSVGSTAHVADSRATVVQTGTGALGLVVEPNLALASFAVKDPLLDFAVRAANELKRGGLVEQVLQNGPPRATDFVEAAVKGAGKTLLDTVWSVERVQASMVSQLALAGFKRPSLMELEVALAKAKAGMVTSWIEKERNRHTEWAQIIQEREQDQVTKMLAAIEAPWARVVNESSSIKSMAELSSIGVALKSVHPFDAGFSDALRADLGDWRNAPVPADAAAWVEPIARTRYYVEQGFDQSLTDFGDRAFAEGLAAAELCEDYLAGVDVEDEVLELVTPEATEAILRARKCFSVLVALELELRAFINRVMTEAYGRDWIQQRVDSLMLEAWTRKSESAKSVGRPFHLLIDAADFTDYEKIICRRDTFAPVFQKFFLHKESVQESFRRLRPLRLDAMHARAISKDDFLFAAVESKRILLAIKATVR